MVFAVLFNLFLPENLKAILVETMKACSFDFFSTEIYFVQIFGFKYTDSFLERFEEAEIEGSNFVILLGPIFIYIVAFFGWLLFKNCFRITFEGCCHCKLFK